MSEIDGRKPRRDGAIAMVALCVAGLVALAAAPAAPGAFPGKNGKIAFDSDRDGDSEIFTINPDGSGERPLTDNDDVDYGAAFSPNGRLIAFKSDRDGDSEVFVMRADGSHEHNVSRNDASDDEPFFTPNGKRIVFQSDRAEADQYDIYSMRLDGTHVRPLTNDSADDGAPTVAADGRIAWVRGDEIWVMRANGTHEHAISDGQGDGDNYPNFSPNGKRIAFERRPEGETYREIYVMRSNGNNAQPRTDNEDYDFAPVFSPDGKKIAWDGAPLGNVRVMRADGTHNHPLTLSPSVDEYADWGVRR